MLFLLAVVSRCASPQLCPTDAELLGAQRRWNNHIELEVSQQANTGDDIVLIMVHQPRRISNVRCGNELPGGAGTINCSFVLRYPHSIHYQVSTLARRTDDWEIINTLLVQRDGD